MQSDQYQRENEIELLFHRQAPRVQQRGFRRELVEVVDLEIEEIVRQEQRGGKNALPHVLYLPRHQHEGSDCQGRQHRQRKRGKDSPCAPFVEMEDAETTLAVEAAHDDAGD